MHSIQNTFSLITGAASGIGRATAFALARDKVHMFLLDINKDKIDSLKQELLHLDNTLIIHTLKCDLGSKEDILATVDRVKKVTTRLDSLINIAGYFNHLVDPFDENTSSFEQSIFVNLTGPVILTNLCMGLMKENPRSSIIFLGSQGSKTPYEGTSHYGCAKFGILGFSLNIFEQCRSKGVKCTCIMPGFVNTPMGVSLFPKEDQERLGKLMIQPEDIAETIQFVLKFPNSGSPTEIIIKNQHKIK